MKVQVIGKPGYEDFEAELIQNVELPDGRRFCAVVDEFDDLIICEERYVVAGGQ